MCLLRYQSPADALIQRLKFRGELACARTLGLLMAEQLVRRNVAMPDAIVPVPLHPRRLAARGYNQSLEIARPIAREFDVPLDSRACRRVRATAEQSDLPASKRGANVAGAFAIAPHAVDRISGIHVAVIDDVMTTGHTAGAVAETLKRAGARRVSVWVCARAI